MQHGNNQTMSTQIRVSNDISLWLRQNIGKYCNNIIKKIRIKML
jgi:hypothetical protein